MHKFRIIQKKENAQKLQMHIKRSVYCLYMYFYVSIKFEAKRMKDSKPWKVILVHVWV